MKAFPLADTRTEANRADPREPRAGTSVVALLVCLAAYAVSTAGAATGPDDDGGTGIAREFRELMGTGVLNNSLGRHRAAEAAFRAATGVCERRFGVDGPECGDSILRLALEISNQGRYREADLLFQRAEQLVRHSSFPLDLPRYLTYRAMDLSNRNDFEAAIRLAVDANQQRKALLKTAFAGARRAEAQAKKRFNLVLSDLAHGLYVQAIVAFRLGHTSEAKITAHLARRLIVKSNNAPDWWVAFVDALLADIDLKEGHFEKAEKRLRLALKTKKIALGNTRAVALSYLALGSIFRQSSRDTQAIEAMRPGLAIVRGELRQTPGVSLERIEPFLEAAYAEATRKPDRRAQLHSEMFAAAQLVRSAATARTVSQIAARFSNDRPEIAEMVHTLQQQTRKRDSLRLALGQLAISIEGRPDRKRIDKLRSAYMAVARRVVALETKLNKVFPRYASLVSPAPVSADDVAALLQPREALVQIVVGDSGGFIFAARADGLTAARLDVTRSELDEAVRKLRAPFEKVGRRVAAYDLEAAHALYRKLLRPVEGSLRNVRHLIVVSSGALVSLPFSLLVTEPPQTRDAGRYTEAAWLIRRMAVTQTPSVRAFASLRGSVRPSTAPLPFIGFGDPTYQGDAGGAGLSALKQHCQLNAPVPAALIRGLPALPETREELYGVARALGAGRDSVFLGADASEAQVRRLPLDRYRVVYFATHGILPGELQCQSEPALALSPPSKPATDRNSDGMLDASEIAGLRLDADLVVLSACNTGAGGGRKFGGDSLSDLARAFFQAGARSMLVSHWKVESATTARLMIGVFSRLASGAGKRIADALRRAQLDLITARETAHPFFWAAFTLIGEGRLDMTLSAARNPTRTIQADRVLTASPADPDRSAGP